jgi:hypothetical protein
LNLSKDVHQCCYVAKINKQRPMGLYSKLCVWKSKGQKDHGFDRNTKEEELNRFYGQEKLHTRVKGIRKTWIGTTYTIETRRGIAPKELILQLI